MFNSDLTKNYNHQDATMEILIMLAGAFLLGCLLCWLFKKLYSQDDVSYETNSTYNETNIQNLTESNNVPQTNASRKVKIVDSPSDTDYAIPRMDDLTKISGLGLDTQANLKENGIKSYTDLRDVERQTLIDALGNSGDKVSRLKEAETWPHQASLAAKGEWKKLSEYQAFIKRAKIASKNISLSKTGKVDDLKKIEGIGPKIEEILNDKGIFTFKELRKTDSDVLKDFIIKEDKRFELNETESWPHQAGMAEKNQWEELGIYQEFMEDDSSDNNDIYKSNVTNISPISKKATKTDSIVSLVDNKDLKADKEITLVSSQADKFLEDYDNSDKKESTNESVYDDLKKIEGIGPKIEQVLNKNYIYTFKELHKTDRDTLKKHLDNAGKQFQMHEPKSWPHQAGMAERGEWDELKLYQEFMDGGREIPSASSKNVEPISLHVNNTTDNKASGKDNLKKIEGIGPKIEELLNDAGINTYEDLKNSNRNALKKLLDAAGPQYRMHEPETWPLQAKMAFQKEWQKLEDYQDFLLGGRE